MIDILVCVVLNVGSKMTYTRQGWLGLRNFTFWLPRSMPHVGRTSENFDYFWCKLLKPPTILSCMLSEHLKNFYSSDTHTVFPRI